MVRVEDVKPIEKILKPAGFATAVEGVLGFEIQAAMKDLLGCLTRSASQFVNPATNRSNHAGANGPAIAQANF